LQLQPQDLINRRYHVILDAPGSKEATLAKSSFLSTFAEPPSLTVHLTPTTHLPPSTSSSSIASPLKGTHNPITCLRQRPQTCRDVRCLLAPISTPVHSATRVEPPTNHRQTDDFSSINGFHAAERLARCGLSARSCVSRGESGIFKWCCTFL
jgi:hypothetical protein